MRRTVIDDRYRVLGPLGNGGMGRVYRALDENLGRQVAVKVLWEHHAESEEFVERFKREARTAAVLHHPNIVSVFDQARARDGADYMVMEYVAGGTLKERIDRNGPLDIEEAADAAIRIAGALEVAHARGVIHRDVKPQNVFLTEAGDLKVGDFGIAQAMWMTSMTATNLILGTVRYLSPEQALGKPVGPASDLYSLGVALYEMLTGETPYKGESPVAIAMKHVSEPSPSPKDADPRVPEGLNAVVVRLLMKDPAERYGSASELIEALERAKSESMEVVTAPGPAAYPGDARKLREERRRGRRWGLLYRSASTMFVMAAVMVSGALGWGELNGVPVGALLRGDLSSADDTIWVPEKKAENGIVGGPNGPSGAQAPRSEPSSRMAQSFSETATTPKAPPKRTSQQPPPAQVATPIPSAPQPQETTIARVPPDSLRPTFFQPVKEAAPEQYKAAPQEQAQEVSWQGDSTADVAVDTGFTPEPAPRLTTPPQYVQAALPTDPAPQLEEAPTPESSWAAASAMPRATTRASMPETILPGALESSSFWSIAPPTPAIPDVSSPGLPDDPGVSSEGTRARR